MADPLVTAVGAGLLGPVIAGPVLARGLDALPAARGRLAAWSIIAAALVFAVAIALAGERVNAVAPLSVLAALPGLLTFVVWRSLLATAVVSLAPMYFVIALATRERPVLHAPYTVLDRLMPLQPAWTLVYGSLYVFAIVLPLLVLRDRALIHRALRAYVAVMLAAYVGFIVYPTVAPRPDEAIAGESFAAWVLAGIYALDSPFNCFPSLHVAYSFVAALACRRVHRRVGAAALVWAALIGLSTVYTKQHYAVDVIAGAAMGWGATAMFFRSLAPDSVPGEIRRRAPRQAATAAAGYVLVLIAAWLAYVLPWRW